MMTLELRPICEHCAVELPPSSANAMICSFECTFCRACVEQLQDVCPNCGGGFCDRPIRPSQNWKSDSDLSHHPAATARLHRPVDFGVHREFARAIASIPALQR